MAAELCVCRTWTSCGSATRSGTSVCSQTSTYSTATPAASTTGPTPASTTSRRQTGPWRCCGGGGRLRARFPPNREQAIFNEIKRELAGDLGVRIRFLDTAHFGGFCWIYHSDMGAACTMHANCCFGLSNKLYDLRKVLGQWRNYTGLTPQEKKSRKFSWKVPAKCGTPDKKNRTTNP
ncbi:hypothetical protein BAE44_0023845 [Dichanthelium oligosanthes]|uniref:Nucleotide-diphospho-sugar transferase domain-containing protein n=1 Tax=Dichanthelium oligosanthes TaxID=888268 RepID=A0A1E5UQP4_9POAL|nr:hypothetical protein BAE44_0023845 [Dichanthelium oligosanthes]